MSIQKKWLVVFSVIVTVFLLSWFLLDGKSASTNLSGDKNGQPEGEISAAQTDQSKNSGEIKWVENLAQISVGKNLTQVVSQNLVSDFISKMNLESASSAKTLTDFIDLNTLKGDGIEKVIAQNPIGFISEIKDEQIKIVLDTETAINNYKKEYSEIIKINEGALVDLNKLGDQIISGLDEVKYKKIAGDLQTSYKKLLDLPAPISLVVFHKQNVVFTNNLGLAVTSILSYQDDPLRAYLALEKFGQISDSWKSIQDGIKNIF